MTLPDGLLLRGYVDRLDVAPNGALRVVDYKTGSMPREAFEAKALFQMKFYALVLWRTRGVVASQLKLLYLGDGDALTYAPDEAELRPLRAHPAGHLGRDRAGRRHRRLPAQQDPALRLVRPPGGLPGLRGHSPAVPGGGRRRGGLADAAARRRARLTPDGPARPAVRRTARRTGAAGPLPTGRSGRRVHGYRADVAFDGERRLPGGALVLVEDGVIAGGRVRILPGTLGLPGHRRRRRSCPGSSTPMCTSAATAAPGRWTSSPSCPPTSSRTSSRPPSSSTSGPA